MAEPLAETLAKQLRRDILRGRLGPGAALKERDTAAELGVSRTPMREAIRILAKDGLVELRPSRSPIVSDPTRKEIIDNLDVLLVLEELSARLAVANATAADIAALHAQNQALARSAEATDEIERFEADMEFHILVTRASHNDELVRLHGNILARMWRVRFGSSQMRRNLDRVVRQHEDILAAIEARNPDAAALAAHEHLEHLVNCIKSDLDALTETSKRSVPG